MALNWGERSVHCFSSSMAWSKFLTYSAYIFRKGVSFCRMSPIRGVVSLWRPNPKRSQKTNTDSTSECIYCETVRHSSVFGGSEHLSKKKKKYWWDLKQDIPKYNGIETVSGRWAPNHCEGTDQKTDNVFAYEQLTENKGSCTSYGHNTKCTIEFSLGHREEHLIPKGSQFKVFKVKAVGWRVTMSRLASLVSHHCPMRFSRSGSRNWLWKVLMEEILEKMFFTTSTGNKPFPASSISLAQNTCTTGPRRRMCVSISQLICRNFRLNSMSFHADIG